MDKLKKYINIKVALFTLLFWIIVNITKIQDIYFSSELMDLNNLLLTIIIVKILHIFFLYFIFLKLYNLIKNRKDSKGRIELASFLIFFIILFMLFIIVYPGTWSWDDIVILRGTASFDFTPWQHFFSGLFQVLCLQTIPIVSGVIFIQILIASLMFGYIYSELIDLYAKSKKQKLILSIAIFIICLFPPIILYVLSGYRMGLYTFIELLVITKLLGFYKRHEKVSIKDIIIISFFIIIISCWRTEAIYYPLIVFILYLILGKEKISKKIAIITLIITVIINLGIGKINNALIGNNNYSITATMEPVTALVKVANETDNKEIEKINKVIDVDFILANPDKNGEDYYWTPGIVKNYTDDEYKEYIKSYAKLAIKYPSVPLKSMLKIFYNAISGQGENNKQKTRNNIDAIRIYDENTKMGKQWETINSLLKYPINIQLRNNLIMFLGGVDEDGNINIIHRLFWNCIIPFVLIGMSLIYKLIKKDWYIVMIIFLIIARIPLVFVAAPAPYFMYYLSAYLCCYILGFLIIFECIMNIKEKKCQKSQK